MYLFYVWLILKNSDYLTMPIAFPSLLPNILSKEIMQLLEIEYIWGERDRITTNKQGD